MGSVCAGCLFASEKTKVVCMKRVEKNRFELAMRAWGDSFLHELCLTRKNDKLTRSFKLTHSSRSWGIVDVREVPALIAHVASSVVYSACDGRFLLLLCARCVLLFGMGYPSSAPCLFFARCELLRWMRKPQDNLQCNCLQQFWFAFIFSDT